MSDVRISGSISDWRSVAHIMGHERGAMSAWYSVMPTRAVGCTLVPSMTEARSLPIIDAPTSEACNAVLGCALPFIGILGLVRRGGQGPDVRWGMCAQRRPPRPLEKEPCPARNISPGTVPFQAESVGFDLAAGADRVRLVLPASSLIIAAARPCDHPLYAYRVWVVYASSVIIDPP